MKNFLVHTIEARASVRDALRKLNTLPEMSSRTLFVINKATKLVGTVTDGDIRRGFLKNLNLTDPITSCMRVNYRYLIDTEDKFIKIKTFRSDDIGLVPVVDSEGLLMDIIDLSNLTNILPVAALIMAGGRGERLKPLTNAVPKPMLEVDGVPIIEHTIRRLKKFGIQDIYISINYLGEKIVEFLGDGGVLGVNIRYLQETQPLGTLGSFSLMPEIAQEHLLILNSDILTDINFQDFFECYLNTGSEMCVASVPYHIQVPYAVLQVVEENITSFIEKPSYNFHSNAGMYLVRKTLKHKIPVNKLYNSTDLMTDLIDNQSKVTHYPHLGYWLDIGQHADYRKAQDDIKRIKF